MKYLLIVVFAYYYVGNTAFIHTHIVDDYLVTHSHPFFPWAHHSHSETNLETVSMFNAICMDASSYMPVVPFILFFLGFIYSQNKVRTAARCFCLYYLRAPPRRCA
ncbi:hypothetical protein AAE250_04185 [Bacteroides sp. GD17]|uniref:hypothetical protein n=1 Tax=Bacteroides sp. GD17 TaxID=3139826 RepID=UPI0025F4AFE4|nr:hypothetical protein [uncultured Bacteroides sp.]